MLFTARRVIIEYKLSFALQWFAVTKRFSFVTDSEQFHSIFSLFCDISEIVGGKSID